MWGYIITFVITVVAGVLVYELNRALSENRRLKDERHKQEQERETALETGVRQLLSVKLEELYDQYANSDSIPRRAYSRWMKLHSAYKGLHGNGTFDHMHEEMDGKHIV